MKVSSKVAIIDFTVTQRGLEDQLLARVVSRERAELEAERVVIFESVMENKHLIVELEDSLLARLTSTVGSLIDDEGLITVLHDTKEMAMVRLLPFFLSLFCFFSKFNRQLRPVPRFIDLFPSSISYLLHQLN